MAERTNRKQIEREAEDHIALGLLLRKRRSQQRRAEVQRIMAGPDGVAQKIDLIRRLDSRSEEDPPVEERTERSAAPRAQQSVKTSPPAASFWSFAFRELPRIRAFGRRTHTLQASWFPPSVRADPAVKRFFVQSLLPWAGELARRLQPVLELGWLHLGKRQYNWVAVLARLADRALATDFAHLSYRDPHLVDSLRRVETPFLLLYSSGGIKAEVLHSLRLVFEKKSRLESEYGPTADLVNRLLDPEGSLPSLYNCLLALNMVRARRLLKLEDLIRPDLRDAVSSTEFDCSAEVRKRIQEYVESTLENAATLHAQLTEVRGLAGYLAYDDKGELDTRLLASLYESKAEGAGGRLEEDQENLMVLAPRLFGVFERALLPLLAGSLTLEGAPKAVLFEPYFFQAEFVRLGGIVEKLEKAIFGFVNFPYKRYLAIRGSSMGAIPKEVEMLQLIDEGLAVLFTLGKSLARVLALSGVGFRAGEPETPLDPSALQGNPFRLPHAERRIESKGFLNGLTVQEAIRRTVSLCFSAGVLLQDPAVFLQFGKESKLAAQLAASLRQLEHLLDEQTFTELKLRYS